MMAQVVTVIADIVESRKITDRADVQQQLEKVLAECESSVEPLQSMRATVGDEFQAVYASVVTARKVLLETKLALPAGLDLRFGIGVGAITSVGDTELQDGPGWWSARAAIEETERRASGNQPWLRTWLCAESADLATYINQNLLAEDFIISQMKAREKRLALMTLRGVLQKEAAAVERISQSAVSQSLQRSGAAALIAAHELAQDFQ